MFQIAARQVAFPELDPIDLRLRGFTDLLQYPAASLRLGARKPIPIGNVIKAQRGISVYWYFGASDSASI